MTSVAASRRPSPTSGQGIWLFAATSFPLQAIVIAVAVYLPQYFAQDLGLDLATVGATFAMVRLIDIPVDPILGVAIDRTNSRFGRYRVWMLAGAPILMLAIFMLFMAPKRIDTAYITIWLLVMYVGTSILTLAHSAWAASLASTYDARSRVFGVMGAVGVAGMTLLLALPAIAPQTGADGGKAMVQGMGWFILAAIPLAVLATVARTPEIASQHVASKASRSSLRKDIALLLHPNMGRIVMAMFFFSVGTTWEGTVFLFYFTDVRGFSPAEASALLMAALAAGFVGAPALSYLSIRISKHGALMVASALYATCLTSLLVIPNSAVALTCVPFITTGFLYAGFHVLLRAMTADVADEILLQQGQERGGALYALITLAPKISAAVAVWATFSILAHVGYRPSAGTTNTSVALDGVRATYVLGPILFVMLGGLCMVGYQLTRARTAEVRELLSASGSSTLR